MSTTTGLKFRGVRLLAAGVLVALALAGTRTWSYDGSFTPRYPTSDAEFYFTRLAYSTNGFGRGFGRDRWLTDWPEAEYHLLQGVSRLTRIDAGDEGRYMGVMEEELFDHPWIYAVEVGAWYLDDVQAARMRDYLLRGGFLMVDDFHGSREWQGFLDSMQRVFPDRPIVEVSEQDAVMHVLYDIDERVQIPGIGAAMSGRTFERDGVTPHWRGIYDDKGRLMVMINFNMDMGDAWEHADFPAYSERYTGLAYRFAINYILYAMTH